MIYHPSPLLTWASLKPFLMDTNMKNRVEFCLSMLDKNSLSHSQQFVDMENVIHIDEKRFYLTKNLLADEEEPHRTCDLTHKEM